MNIEETDIILIKKFLADDNESFAKIYQRYKDMVYNISCKIVGEQEAADVTQETFVTVYRKLGQFDFRASFKTWLYRIVINSCLLVLRKRRKGSVTVNNKNLSSIENAELLSAPDRRDEPEKILADKEFDKVLQDALFSLKEKHRALFTMVAVEKLSYSEASDIFNCSTKAVKSQLCRIRNILKDKLEPYIKG
ncbi:MAG: sigma-70 family RNA polymerase sigma factor [Elusimicrobia bacterium]|nr:sigma-70 family RNA polymerase sigma factor [Elusimicrobiota bacterium]